jgi:solute carrier family 25 uncoupling protein 8/9
VKVRFQSEGRLAPGQVPRYSGVMNAYSTIIRQEGFLGLWTGIGPAIMRNSIINATELASYETAKEFFLYKLGFRDNLQTHILSGSVAGFMATIIGNPIDVVKTRVMAQVAGSGPTYNGAIDCIMQTLRKEGPLAFYQGVVPQFYRITGWNIVMFVTLEQLKAVMAANLR